MSAPLPPVPQHHDLPTEWTKPPVIKPKLYQRKWFAPALAAFVALIVGFSMGATDDPKPAASNGPAEVVTSPSPVASPSPVNVTPQSCKVALKYADAGFGNAQTGFEIVAKAFDAVSSFDTDALQAETDKLSGLQPKLAANISKYATARDECLAAG